MFEEPYYKKFASEFKTIDFDQSRPVRKIVMKADQKGLYGLKFLDKAGKSVWETRWSSKGDLVTYELEQGSSLVGIKFDGLVHRVGFISAKFNN